MQKLQFYYRDGCHLCEDMWQLLRELQGEMEFHLEALNIDEREADCECYSTLIPVLADGDKIICNYYLDKVAVRSHLRASG